MEDFIQAVKDGDASKVSAMVLAQSSLVDARDSSGATAVQTAVYNFHRAIAGFLVESGATLDLASACCFGATAKVADLVTRDNVNRLTRDGFCLLALAAAFGGLETARVLIEEGADVNLRGTSLGGVAALHASIFGRNNAVLKLLLDSGANPNLTQQGGFTALMGAAMNRDAEAVAILLQFGADLNVRTDDGKSAMDFAVEAENDEVKALLAAKIGVH